MTRSTRFRSLQRAPWLDPVGRANHPRLLGATAPPPGQRHVPGRPLRSSTANGDFGQSTAELLNQLGEHGIWHASLNPPRADTDEFAGSERTKPTKPPQAAIIGIGPLHSGIYQRSTPRGKGISPITSPERPVDRIGPPTISVHRHIASGNTSLQRTRHPSYPPHHQPPPTRTDLAVARRSVQPEDDNGQHSAARRMRADSGPQKTWWIRLASEPEEELRRPTVEPWSADPQ